MIGPLQTILGLLTIASPAAAIYVSVPAALPAGVLVESRLDHTEAYAAGIQCLRGMGGLDLTWLLCVAVAVRRAVNDPSCPVRIAAGADAVALTESR